MWFTYYGPCIWKNPKLWSVAQIPHRAQRMLPENSNAPWLLTMLVTRCWKIPRRCFFMQTPLKKLHQIRFFFNTYKETRRDVDGSSTNEWWHEMRSCTKQSYKYQKQWQHKTVLWSVWIKWIKLDPLPWLNIRRCIYLWLFLLLFYILMSKISYLSFESLSND